MATFPVGSVSAKFSGAATFLGMRFPKNVVIYKIWLHFLVRFFLATFPGVATFLVVTRIVLQPARLIAMTVWMRVVNGWPHLGYVRHNGSRMRWTISGSSVGCRSNSETGTFLETYIFRRYLQRTNYMCMKQRAVRYCFSVNLLCISIGIALFLSVISIDHHNSNARPPIELSVTACSEIGAFYDTDKVLL